MWCSGVGSGPLRATERMSGGGVPPSRTLVYGGGTIRRRTIAGVGERCAAASGVPPAIDERRPAADRRRLALVSDRARDPRHRRPRSVDDRSRMPRRSTSWPSSSSGRSAGRGRRSATAIGSFLVYDLLFTEPASRSSVADPVELLNLVLVLIVALAVGRLAALGRERAAEADRRATEATASFAISRLHRDRRDHRVGPAGPIVERLTRDVPLDRVWVTLEARATTGPSPTRAPGRSRPRQSSPRSSGRRATSRRDGSAPTSRPARQRVAATTAHADRDGERHPGQDRDRRERSSGRCGRSTRRPTTGPLDTAAHAARLPGRRPDRPRPAARSAARRGDRAPRSRAGATPSRAHCSTRSPTTCGRRWRASGRRPGTWPTRTSRVERPRSAPAAEIDRR